MEVMQGLQEAIAVSRAEQERIQLELVALQERNQEVCRANEELRRGMGNHPGNREAEDRECFTPPREFPMPFSQSIKEAVIPPTFVGLKVTFTGMEDPEAHLIPFHTQMMLDGRGPSTSPHESPPMGRFGPTLELWPRGSKKTFFYMFKWHKL